MHQCRCFLNGKELCTTFVCPELACALFGHVENRINLMSHARVPIGSQAASGGGFASLAALFNKKRSNVCFDNS